MKDRSVTKAYYYRDDAFYDQPVLSPFDRGFTLGDGVFETCLYRGGQVIRLAAHIERMRNALEILDISPPPALEQDTLAALSAEGARKNGFDACIIRFTVTRGIGGRGLNFDADVSPSFTLTFSPLPAKIKTPITVAFSSIRRNEQSPLSKIKSLNYLENILALKEAKQNGAEEAILLNTQSRVACATIGNVIAQDAQGRFFTPPPEEGCLPGTYLKALMTKKQGLITYRPLEARELYAARKVFICNAVRGVMRVGKILSD